MKAVTSVTIFNDAVGMRMSVTYSEIDEISGKIIADNKRIDRVVTDADARAAGNALTAYAQAFVDEQGETA